MSEQKKRKVAVCHGPKCGAQFAEEITREMEMAFGQRPDVEVTKCGCLSSCSLANNIMIDDQVIISRNTPRNAVANIEKALAGDIYGAGGGVEVDPFNLEDDKFLGI